ncbi:MAG TPA: 2-oxoglutarate dehydrogenase E1 component [Thermomicrobiales bacterium]|nr:2-oxoglutarate dehydrogenase E1 component [Thermomicrobiales bacterium]
MTDLRGFVGPNAGYVLELYDRYLADPSSVDAATRDFFATFDASELSSNGASATLQKPGIGPATAAGPASPEEVKRIVGAATLGIDIREYGHLAADLDPLGSPPPSAPELDPATHGITEGDLERLPASVVDGPVAEGAANAAEAIARLRLIYSGTIGYDFDHIQVPEERTWLRNAVESRRFAAPLEPAAKRALLRRLTDVEAFERFLHQTYLGQKRFSVEGNDIVVPMLDRMINEAASRGTQEILVGMSHRGRLNVMTHVLGKPYGAIIAAFEGNRHRASTSPTDGSSDLTGDVKYHLGARLMRRQDGTMVEVPLVLAPNPSHLEAVNPVVGGMTRAAQDQRNQPGQPAWDPSIAMAIILHGDAAFTGQGIVAETLNMSGLAGYTTGGVIHIIVNNQIGFTTDTPSERSTLYSSDVAKGYEIPIIHVNADDAEACLSVTRMAMAYRAQFGKDFLIDLIGYRRWGHNEGDEPAFTQPKMYAIITKHPTVRKLLADRLAAEAVVNADESDAMLKDALDKLAAVRRSVTDGTALPAEETPARSERREVETAITPEQLRDYQAAIHALPDGFKMNAKLKRQWQRRASILDTPDGEIDWANAESLAFAAILSDGTPIRFTGQDTQRGTFSQRHLVLHDPDSGETYTPLDHLSSATASFAVYNSPLSEQGAVGFEYGYSVHAPEALVLWEAQFGDFANGAQVIIDQFLVAARAKWGQEPSLVLLLPHGYEGQGPEHSSGRLERYLQLSAQDNIRVANCTTSAQYFHLLRRQAALLSIDRRPLILMTPKSLLRHPLAASKPELLTQGTFKPVLDDPRAEGHRDEVTRLILCSGKVFVDLESSEARAEAIAVAIARVEQLAPFQNTALRELMSEYPNLMELVWLQEEPKNMGAWTYMEPRLRELTGGELPIRYIGRPERASPAEGSAERHAAEQQRIVSEAFADVPERKRSTNGRAKGNGRSTRQAKNGTAAEATAKAPS